MKEGFVNSFYLFRLKIQLRKGETQVTGFRSEIELCFLEVTISLAFVGNVIQFQFKRFFIVQPHIKKTYNGEIFHGHCYNALTAKLTRRKNDFGIIIVSTIHSVWWIQFIIVPPFCFNHAFVLVQLPPHRRQLNSLLYP